MDILNQGYKITDHVSVDGNHYAVGEHTKKNVPAPYVSWMTNEDMSSFYFGHYFTEREDALADMVKRATYLLERKDGIPLSVDFLAENAQEALAVQFADERAKESIRDALMDVLDCDVENPRNRTEEEILNAPGFFERARRAYDNLDHSKESYALRQSLTEILDDHPEFLKPELQQLHSIVRIPPEMISLIRDILSMPTAAIPEKYGALGDSIRFEFPFENGMKATLTLLGEEDPYDNHKLSETEPHFVNLSVLDAEGFLLCGRSYTSEDLNAMGNGAMAGIYEISVDYLNLILELQEDESLRRTGNSFVFHASTESEPYREHDGETCTIRRALTSKEHDVLCTGLMWEAEFPNGDHLHVFDSELAAPVLIHKPSLAEQISAAQDKTAVSAQKSEAKENQR